MNIASYPGGHSSGTSSAAYRAAQWAIYPLIFGGGVAAIVASVGAGVSYWRVGPPVLAVAALLVALLERWMPHARAWTRDHDDTRTDVAHFVANVAVSQASAAAYVAVHTLSGGALRLWPLGAPFWVQFLLGVLVIDLALYVIHRTSHVVRWMWKFHAIHHSATRLYWVNGQRRHLVHELLEGAPSLLVLGLLGAPPAAVACGLAAVTLHLFLQHGNVAYRVGALRHVFAVAQLHRWHHQRRYEDVQGNYGAILSIWDSLFGTALREKKGEAPLDVGMDDEPTLPADWIGQLRWPFR